MITLLLGILALLAPRQHLTVAPGASALSAKAGAKVSVFVDVLPDQGIHVYAPGAKDYRPIAMTIDAHAGAAIGPVIYPKSDTMSFDGESVPVFQKPFRLATDVTIARSAKPGTALKLTGRIDYQACDDRVCFIPASLPVSWTIDVK